MVYLSEMAISDRHGGGLTLQRILGRDLADLETFVHFGGFARQSPPAPKFQHVPWIDTPLPMDSHIWWTLPTRYALAWLHGRRWFRRSHAARAARRVKRRRLPADSPWLICPQGDLAMRTMNGIHQQTGARYAAWMMDDHLLKLSGDRWSYCYDHREVTAECLRNAAHVFVISPAMGDFYRSEFGIESTVLFGPADPVGKPVWTAPTATGPLHLAYFGNLWDWQRDALETLAPVLARNGCALDIFTGHAIPDTLRTAGARRLDPIPETEVLARAGSYDAVVLPISFQEKNAHLARLNIATKMSECLASGTGTLVIGPPDAAMARYLEGTNAAVLAHDPALHDWDRIEREIREPNQRRAMLTAARNLVEERLTTARMRQVWHEGWQRVAAP